MDNGYDILAMLKRVCRAHPREVTRYRLLEQHRDNKSNNILVICKTKKDCNEAIKFIARDHLGECKAQLTKGILKIKDATIIFTSVAGLDEHLLPECKFKDFYFEEEFNL